MKKIFFIPLLLTLCVTQFSCKKDNDPEPVSIDQNAIIQQNGSISGTINTSSAASATENFSYSFPYSGGSNIYSPSNNTINFNYGKSLDTFISGTDMADGSLTFGATDSTKSAPTSWSIYLTATNPNTGGIFLFNTGSPITQTNSSITNYSFSGNTMSFKITTNAYLGSNGKAAIVVADFSLPVVNGILRMGAK